METTTIETNFRSEEYFINMGPQHPATHGVLRLLLTIDGEIIKESRARSRLHSSFYRKNV